MVNQGYRYRQVLGPLALGHTAHSYLVSVFPHSTAAQWRIRLDAGEVLLNEVRAHWCQPVIPGQILIWNRPPWTEEDTPHEYAIIYQDETLLAVDKPSGLPTLPGGGFYRNTLLSLVRADFPSARPLHRLGRGTSGLVLFAMDTKTASTLHRCWPKVHKQYQALAIGVALVDDYDIRCPIGPVDHGRLGTVYAASPTGKAAQSLARVLQRHSDSTIFEVDLMTGRPHQIRIHLASIGHPLVGDPLYAPGGVPKPDRPGLPGDTGYSLHAKRLIFEHPLSRKLLDLSAPIPESLQCESIEKTRGVCRLQVTLDLQADECQCKTSQ